MVYPIKNWIKLKRGYKFREKTFYSEHHLGLDIIAPSGTPIYAWQDLNVIDYKYGKEGGNTILIKCPNNIRLFRIMHLLHSVKKGFYKEGTVVCYVGNTGSMSRGSHSHLDISKNGVLNINNINNFEDPEAYFASLNYK